MPPQPSKYQDFLMVFRSITDTDLLSAYAAMNVTINERGLLSDLSQQPATPVKDVAKELLVALTLLPCSSGRTVRCDASAIPESSWCATCYSLRHARLAAGTL